MSRGMKVLVTGGSGRLGRILAKHLSDTYALRLTYNAHPFEAPGCEVVQMDLTDFDSVLRAMQGVQAVVHFGADSALQTPWESTLNNNIVGTYNAYEAARQAGVPRFVFASSNHAAGFDIAEGKLVGPDAPVRPDSLYGVSKVFGEALGRYYHVPVRHAGHLPAHRLVPRRRYLRGPARHLKGERHSARRGPSLQCGAACCRSGSAPPTCASWCSAA